MVRNHLWRLSAASLATALFASEAASAVRVDDIVQVGGRVAAFLQPPMSGAAVAAIVYEPGDAASEAEARSIERSIGSGAVGSLRLTPRRVATNALSGLSGAKIAFVTRGTNYRAIASAATPRAVLTISSDAACTQAGHCVIAVSSTPRVQIFVSKSAARSANLKFNASFLMLVKEV